MFNILFHYHQHTGNETLACTASAASPSGATGMASLSLITQSESH